MSSRSRRDEGQVAGFGRAFESHGVAAFAVAFFQIRRENQADLRQGRHDGRRNGRDRIVEVLAQVLFGHRQGGEIGELTGEWNHLAAKTRSQLFHRQLGRSVSCGHPRGSIVSGRHAKLISAHANSESMPRKILVSAGEASGDLYAALVVEELRRSQPGRRVFRLHRTAPAGGRRAHGGGCCQPGGGRAGRGGAAHPAHLRRISQAAGGGAKKSGRIWRFSRIRRIFTCGWPGACTGRAFRWSTWWRRRPGPGAKGACAQMRRTLRHLLCIFPFEEEFFRREGVPATYIGHPLAGLVRPGAHPRRVF